METLPSSILLPLDKARTASPRDTLDAAFSRTESSHDAVFVFDKGDVFLGLVSPSYCLFRNRFTYKTKVKSCLVGPPHITSVTPLPRIAEFMLSTGIYQLPVFRADGSIAGVIGAHALLEMLASDASLLRQAAKQLKPRTPLRAPLHSSVQDLYKILRGKGVSRIVLVDKDSNVLRGILSRHDIQRLLVKPTQRQKLSTGGTRGGRARDYALEGEKETRLQARAEDFVVKDVLTATMRTDLRTLLRRMLEAKKNSIVLVDAKRRPAGIVTMHLVLRALSSLKPEQKIPVHVVNHAGLPAGDIAIVRQEAEKFATKLARRSSPERVELVLDEARNPAGRPVQFEVKCDVPMYAGGSLFAKARNRKLLPAVREAFKGVASQERRNQRDKASFRR